MTLPGEGFFPDRLHRVALKPKRNEKITEEDLDIDV